MDVNELGFIKQQIVAMRGRNPENPSDRTPGIELEQRLELNEDGICNVLTTVQKDNLVLETDYIAYDEQNKCIRDDVFGTLTTDGSSPKHNNRVIESKKIKIRQATKDGFVDCEIGGGGGFGISIIGNTQGKSDRERKDMSDTNNGEHP